MGEATAAFIKALQREKNKNKMSTLDNDSRKNQCNYVSVFKDFQVILVAVNVVDGEVPSYQSIKCW